MLIAGPNLTIDRTAALAQLRPGEVLRFDRVVVTPGGKGLNVARAARALGHPALLVSFVPGHTGRAAAALIGEEGVELSGVPCGGELRSTMIVQERGGRTTVLNEPGPAVDERRWADYENAVRGRLTSRSVLVCSGSVPPGAPADAYGRLVEIAHTAGARAVVDAAGSTLLRALDAAPDVVTPNLAEAEGALGLGPGGTSVESGPDARPRATEAAEALLRQAHGRRWSPPTRPARPWRTGSPAGSRRRAWPRSATRSGRATCCCRRWRRLSNAARRWTTPRAREWRRPPRASSTRPRGCSSPSAPGRWRRR
jgi:fructose-1-phosphate kinase PfkB-like protein